jgi:hypothetical protein
MNWRFDPITVAVAMALAVAALGGIWWLWWRLPKQQVGRLRLTIRDPKARADIEDNFRKTIGQLLGGLVVLLGGTAALLGAALGYLQFQQQQRTSQQQFSEQQQTSQRQFSEQQKASGELLVSNQVSKGFEQLGNEKSIVVRLGGIYALEGVMNNSEQYRQPVLEALCAFVREGTRTITGDGPPAADIQAALRVIGRRVQRVAVDLTNVLTVERNTLDLTEVQSQGRIWSRPISGALTWMVPIFATSA